MGCPGVIPGTVLANLWLSLLKCTVTDKLTGSCRGDKFIQTERNIVFMH